MHTIHYVVGAVRFRLYADVEPRSALNVDPQGQSMYTQIYEHTTLRYRIIDTIPSVRYSIYDRMNANPDSIDKNLEVYEDYFIRF